MDFQRLRTFRTVATLMNFNQAAKVMNYAQSSISSQIKTLENEIGAPLFHRFGKKIVLTNTGEKMLKYAQKLLAIEEEARAEISGKTNDTSLLTVRMPQTVATYHLPGVLADFQSFFPKIHLDISSCARYSLEHELSIGIIDLAFLLTDSVDAASLEFELLKVERLVLVAFPGHPLMKKKRTGYRDLQGQVLFLPKADCGYRMTIEQILTAEQINPTSVIEINSIEAIKEAVINGLGVTIIPEIAVRNALEHGKLAELPWEEDLETGVCMIWSKDKWFSPALESFMNSFRKILASSPTDLGTITPIPENTKQGK
ncbi:MAG: LysR family transcriptional regulator [Deltaproteobacteria bacterium]|nr:LysR family transcriptional regulator [Deltaproteobacteria bacterium]